MAFVQTAARPASRNGAEPSYTTHLVRRALQSPGVPLAAETRAFMEPRLGHHFANISVLSTQKSEPATLKLGAPASPLEEQAERVARGVMASAASAETERPGCDLSAVRVHTGPDAGASARALGALAYTVGNHIVFGEGKYAPGTEGGRHVLAHELAHTVQANASAGAGLVQRILIFGNGYQRPREYTSNAAELASAQAGTWFPSSLDFAATAANSGGGVPARTLDDFVSIVNRQGKGSIHALGIIGHAAGGGIGLSGTISVHPADVEIPFASAINGENLQQLGPDWGVKRDRFASDAVVTLYGCNSGTSALLRDLSNALGACVRGFQEKLDWCILSQGDTLTRGRAQEHLPAQCAPGDPFCDQIRAEADRQRQCANFSADIRALQPEHEFCGEVYNPLTL